MNKSKWETGGVKLQNNTQKNKNIMFVTAICHFMMFLCPFWCLKAPVSIIFLLHESVCFTEERKWQNLNSWLTISLTKYIFYTKSKVSTVSLVWTLCPMYVNMQRGYVNSVRVSISSEHKHDIKCPVDCGYDLYSHVLGTSCFSHFGSDTLLES